MFLQVAAKTKAKKTASKTKENADPNKPKSPKATKAKPKESKNQEPGINGYAWTIYIFFLFALPDGMIKLRKGTFLLLLI